VLKNAKFRILLVEDQLRHQRVYTEALTAHLPTEVQCVATGAAALAVLGLAPNSDAATATNPPRGHTESLPELIILDLDLQDMRGETVLARIRADHRLRLLPVIVLTGSGGVEKHLEVMSLGADDFLEKGCPPSVLIARLRTQMRHKIAVEKLSRMALDRDLFAAGVLQDIDSSKSTIIALCNDAIAELKDDPVARKPEILAALEKLSLHASKLGGYAADIIQSVRDTQRAPNPSLQDIPELLAWVSQVLTGNNSASAAKVPTTAAVGSSPESRPISWAQAGPMQPVRADRSFLRLGLLNLVRYVLSQTTGAVGMTLSQSPIVDLNRSNLGNSAPLPEELAGGTLTCLTVRASGSLTLLPPSADSANASLSANVDDPAAGSSTGLNLGLTLVNRVVERMHGQIWASVSGGSVQDSGPSWQFYLALPK